MSQRILLFLLLLPAVNPALAQWGSAQVLTHPRLPEDRSFVLEVNGSWGNACNPSTSEPVITHFDGESLEIDFLPGNCPPSVLAPYPYRVLVDISPAFTGNETMSLDLDVTLRFGNDVLEETILLSCALCDPPPPPQRVYPEPGLYQAYGHEKQGLLLARQGAALAVYPLVYDEEGSAEWLFAGGTIEGDAYFAPLYQATGGQCLGCPPPTEPPSLDPIGDVTMVFDTQGVLQMQIDDGAFIEYRQLNYGHAVHGAALADPSGTWAILDSPSQPADAPVPRLDTVLPAVFEIRFVEVLPQPIVGTPPPAVVLFHIRDLEHQVLAEMVCESVSPFSCDILLPGGDDPEYIYRTVRLSAGRMSVVPGGEEAPVATIVRAEP